MFNIHSLRVKIFLIFCIILAILLFIDFFYLYPKIQKKYIETSIIYQKLFADQIVNNIEFSFQDGINKLEAIAQMPEIISMEKKKLDDILKKYESMTSEEKITDYNIPCLRKDKRIIYVDISSKENINIKGKIYNVGFFTDVTDRKKAEDELKKYQDHLEELVKERTCELQEKNKELETFSYSISHDLKTPLRHIQGFSNILFDEYSTKHDKEAIRIINVINRSTNKMANLIDDLLEFTKTTQQDLNLVKIDPNKLIEEIIKDFNEEIINRNIKINIKNLIKI